MTDPAPVDATETGRRRSLITDVLWGSAAALASLVLAAWKVGAPESLSWLWIRGDTTVVYAFARALQRNAFITPNPDLAYPFGQDLASFPTPDLLSLAELKALVLLTGDPMAAVNSYILLSFAVVTISMFILLRVLRVATPLAAVIAVAFSVVPWHFDRFVHPFLANYSSVPLGLLLIVAILDWNIATSGPRRMRPRTLLLLLALVVYIGLSGTYYAAFLALLALVALAFQAALGRRDWGLLVGAWLAALPVLVSFTAGAAYRLTTDAAVSLGIGRAAQESQIYSGSMYTLLRTTRLWSEEWPVPGLHLVPTFNPAGEADARNSTIGLIAVALAFVCAGLILAANGQGRRFGFTAALRYWPWLFMVSLLFFIAGGFGQVFSFAYLNQVRSWGRFSIIVIAIALVILGLVLTYASRRTRHARGVVAGSTLIIALVVVMDTASMPAPIDATSSAAGTQELRQYGTDLDAAVPEGCPILTVPIYPFPEWFVWDGAGPYDPLLPYLTADHPRWSYGGVLGTPAGDWALRTISPVVPRMVAQAKAAGFCAIQLDTASQADFAPSTQDMTDLLGAPIARSSTGRWQTFSLDAVDPAPFSAQYMEAPVAFALGDDLEDEQPRDWSLRAPVSTGSGTLAVTNPAATAVSGTVELDVLPTACPSPVEVTLDTGTGSASVTVDGAPATASVPLDLPAGGATDIRITAPGTCEVEIRDPRFIPSP